MTDTSALFATRDIKRKLSFGESNLDFSIDESLPQLNEWDVEEFNTTKMLMEREHESKEDQAQLNEYFKKLKHSYTVLSTKQAFIEKVIEGPATWNLEGDYKAEFQEAKSKCQEAKTYKEALEAEIKAVVDDFCESYEQYQTQKEAMLTQIQDTKQNRIEEEVLKKAKISHETQTTPTKTPKANNFEKTDEWFRQMSHTVATLWGMKIQSVEEDRMTLLLSCHISNTEHQLIIKFHPKTTQVVFAELIPNDISIKDALEIRDVRSFVRKVQHKIFTFSKRQQELKKLSTKYVVSSEESERGSIIKVTFPSGLICKFEVEMDYPRWPCKPVLQDMEGGATQPENLEIFMNTLNQKNIPTLAEILDEIEISLH